MNRDPIPSGAENQNDSQDNENFNIWQEAMKDVVFRGGGFETNGDAALSGNTAEFQSQTPEADTRPPRKSLSEAIRALSNQEKSELGERAMYPKTEIICGNGDIEGQRIDVISKEDRGIVELRFKLRDPSKLTIPELKNQAGQAEASMPSGAILKHGKIAYEDPRTSASLDLCDASVFERDGVKVFIADPTSRNGSSQNIGRVNNASGLIHAAIGLIKIEAPSNNSPDDTEMIIKNIMEQDLGIPGALDEVSKEAELEYKKSRYKWQHRIIGELTAEQIAQAEKLEREEVFPGYSTFVEKGKHKEYLKQYGENIRAIHRLHDGGAESINRVLTHGLMSTTERYSRGFMAEGMSSSVDADTGGADGVFTRITNDPQISREGTVIVFKPEIFDRTDWYSSNYDSYGSTDYSIFKYRLSPDEILSKIPDADPAFLLSNEQTFRTGIGPNYIESILVEPRDYNNVISGLHSMGVKEIDGKPVEEFITPRNKPPASIEFIGFSKEYLEKQEQIKAEKQEQIKAEKQASLQEIMAGKKPYTDMAEIFELLGAEEGYATNFKNLSESLIAQGKKEQFSNDLAIFLKNELGDEALKTLASGETLDGLTDDDKELLLYARDALGIDFSGM